MHLGVRSDTAACAILPAISVRVHSALSRNRWKALVGVLVTIAVLVPATAASAAGTTPVYVANVCTGQGGYLTGHAIRPSAMYFTCRGRCSCS